MAAVSESRIYSGAMAENGTITVSGRGMCTIKVVGNTWGSGTIALKDNIANNTLSAIDKDGTVQTLTTGQQTWNVYYSSVATVTVALTGATNPDIDVYVAFERR